MRRNRKLFTPKNAYFAHKNNTRHPMQMLSYTRIRGLLFLIACLCSAHVPASIRLPRFISEGMVLQRHQPVQLWGWAEPGQTVRLELAVAKGRFPLQSAKGAGKAGAESLRVAGACLTATAVADADGRFAFDLPAMKAAGPMALTLSAPDQTVRLADVWVGDVWLLSGQSNIDVNLERVHPQYPDEIDRDSTDRVHIFQVQNEAVLEGPRQDVRSSGWHTLSARTAWHFTALGYFLGKRMAAETGVVQGVIQSSWGGTPIEAWLPIDSVRSIDPRMATQAQLYADAELRRAANEANNRAAQRWNQLLDAADPGVVGQWAQPALDESGWQSASQYRLPVPPGPFCGTLWLRQHIRVDAAHAGQQALLLLGTLVDADRTYLNGRMIGQTFYQYPPRRYAIPAGLLKEGDNVLTVRFVNRGLAPCFVPEKPYRIEWADGTAQPLAEQWLCRMGTTMPDQPSIPTGFQNMAAATYNGMLLPLAPYGLAGVVWYQGESNTERAEVYERQLHSLMGSWRAAFKQPQLPFVIVQLPGFMAPSAQPQESGWARLRESQRRAAAADAHAGLAVAIDLGEANDIHPLRKKEVAQRVALVLDRLVYGKQVPQAPQPLRAESRSDGTVVVSFDQPVHATQGFELDGNDGRFRQVKATTQGSRVVLQGTGRRVRYAWKHNPTEADCRAADARALPATPFQLDVQPAGK